MHLSWSDNQIIYANANSIRSLIFVCVFSILLNFSCVNISTYPPTLPPPHIKIGTTVICRADKANVDRKQIGDRKISK